MSCKIVDGMEFIPMENMDYDEAITSNLTGKDQAIEREKEKVR